MTESPKGLATLFDVAAYHALDKRPRPGRPLTDKQYVAALIPLKRLMEYLLDPEAYAAERAREENFNRDLERLRRVRLSAPPVNRDRISVQSSIVLGLRYHC